MQAERELLNNISLADFIFYMITYAIESDSDRPDIIPWSTPVMQHFAFSIIFVYDL